MLCHRYRALLAVAIAATFAGLASLGQVPGPPIPGEPGLGEPVPGKPGPGEQVQFDTPFIVGITAFLVGRITDCLTGDLIPPEMVTAEFILTEGKEPPFTMEDIQMVILSAGGYASEVITEFIPFRVSLFFVEIVYVVPVQQAVCLVPLAEGVCKVCTVKLEILSDNGSVVKARLTHCGEGGRWEQWFKGDLPRHKEPPPEKCRTCTYWLRYEQVEGTDQHGNPFATGKYTLYHCNPDNVWNPVFVLAISKAKELPKGKCTPGAQIIVTTETKRGDKIYIRHDLYRCSSEGKWVLIGSWTEEKGAAK